MFLSFFIASAILVAVSARDLSVWHSFSARLTHFDSFVLQINMRVDDVNYEFRFEPQITKLSTMAQQFCIEQGARHGVTQESLPTCIAKVEAYLQASVVKETEAVAQQPAASSTSANALKVCNILHSQ